MRRPTQKTGRQPQTRSGLQFHVLTASTVANLETAFAVIMQRQIGALLVGIDGLFNENREQLAALVARHGIPAIYDRRDFPAAGGLMSYGASNTDQYRQVGVYTGRILKGEKPVDLPVQQATKFEFVINLKTAKALGLVIPPTMLAIAEVIE
jgi:putative tryptophan/tyrosine transport system substrate-binding protein